MPDINVRAYLDQLRSTLPYVPPLPTAAIKALHNKRDFGGIVVLIRKTMNVGVNLAVHWTSVEPPGELPGARAWIEIPAKMPYYGTNEFKAVKLDVFVLKSFRDSSDYQEFAIAIAHELSHVVLESIHHPLRHEEKAVDLTAMLLGFSYVYRNAAHAIRWIDDKHFVRRRLGYLTPAELDEACRVLIPQRLRAFVWAKRYAARLVIVGSFAALIGASVVSTEWEKHQIATAEAATIRRIAPQIIGPSTILEGASAGLASVTLEYLVTKPISDAAWVAAKAAVHRAACAKEGAHIARGISYVYDYHDAKGQRLAQFEVSSCP